MTTKLTTGSSTTPLRTKASAFLAILCLSILVGCQGFSSAAPAPTQQTTSLSVGSSILNFGNVVVGSSKTMTVTATNSGTASITLSGAAVSTKYFAVTAPSLPLTIAAGQSTQITVRFTPNASGPFNGAAAVTASSGSQLTNIALAGTGVTSGGQLSLNSTSESFGSVIVGAQQPQTVTLTNTEASNVTISQASVAGAGFQLSGITTPTTLTPSQSVSFTVSFAPSAAGSASGSLTIVSDAVDPSLTMPLTGTGVLPGALVSTPASLDFGSVTIGNNQSLSETITNTGGSSVTISQATISGTGFSLSGITTPITLTSGQSTSFTVKFAPGSAASASGNVTITSTASNPTLAVALAGIGVAPGGLGSSPSSLNFGSLTVGSNQSLSETLTNIGGASVTISQVVVSGTGFSLTGVSTPITLSAGQSTTFSVKFTPGTAGSASGSVTVTSTASNPTLTVALSGAGVAPGALGASPSSLNFGSVTVGNNQSLSETVTNTGGSSVTISQVAISGTGFSLSGITTPITLTAGQSTVFTVKFTPGSAGSASGSVTITSTASNPTLTVALSGTGVAPGALGSNPTSLNFGSVTVGSNQSLSETVTNNGGTSVTISQVAVSGTGFSLTGVTTPTTLTAGQSTTFSVTFTPASAAATTGTVTITSTASNPSLTVALSGTGVAPGALGSSPSSLNFGSVTLGNNQSLSETVTNTGGASVTISQVAISGTGFTLSGITAPVTLVTGQSVTFTIKFAPTSAGSASGNVTVTSNAPNPTLTIPLSGTAVTPGALGSNPTSLNFGSITVGSNQSLSETVTNTGGASVTISQVAVNGTGFTLSGITTPVTLTAGQSTTFTAKFAPGSVGSASGSISLTSTASNPTLTVNLSGTGVAPGALGSNPTSLNFGNVTVGSNQSLSETVTNTGGASVTISQVAASGTGFSVSGVATPITLTAGQSTTFTVSLNPGSVGSASGSITVTSTASNPTLTVTLSGTGVAPGALGSNPTSLSFGTVTVGSNQSLSETVTNTGGASVTISQVVASGSGFSLSGITTPVTLTSGQSATFTVKFAPGSAGSASGTVTVISTASNSTLAVPLSGTGVAVGTLGSSPASLNFGSVTVGSNQSLSETVTNTGGASVTISQVAASGTGFSLSGITTPVTLTSGQGVTFTVKFAPTSAGSASGNVTVTSTASNPSLSVGLSGTGAAAAGQLTITPTTLNLGSVVVGTSGSASGSLSATGANVTVTAAGSNNSVFSLGSLSLPVTIAAGQSVPYTITFSPQTPGTANATLTVTSNAQSATTTEVLTGTGTAAPTHTVNLTWNASTSSGVTGYNIYRAVYTTSCGSYSKVNSNLVTSTLYADPSVIDGTSYCYAATAVNSSNQESGYSNIASNVQIPAP